MLKKVLKITIPSLLFIFIVYVSIDEYIKASKTTTTTLISFIPNDANFVLQFNNVEKLRNFNKQNNFLFDFSENNSDIHLHKTLTILNDNYQKLNTKSILISFHRNKSKYSNLVVTNFKKEINSKKILKLFSSDFKKNKILDQEVFFSKKLKLYLFFKNDILLLSQSKYIIEKSISNKNMLVENESFIKSYRTIDTKIDVNLLFNANSLLKSITNDRIKNKKFANWICCDLIILDNGLKLIGSSVLDPNANNFVDKFQKNSSSNLDILNLITSKTSLLFATSFEDSKKFKKNKKPIKITSTNEDVFLFDINEFLIEIKSEAGVFSLISDSTFEEYSYFNVKEVIKPMSLIQPLIDTSIHYNSFKIHSISKVDLSNIILSELYNLKYNHFTIIDNFFIYGRTIKSLEFFIDSYLSRNDYYENKFLKSIDISKTGNINLFLNTHTFKSNYSKEISLLDRIISSFNFINLSLSSDINKNMHFESSLSINVNNQNVAQEVWNYKFSLNQNFIQFVENYYTNSKLVLTQDTNNYLHALNLNGKKIWSTKIKDRIIGKISTIDYYKNNKIQYLFNTKNHLYIIDRLGNVVKGFPIQLPIETYLGHSIFDYDNDKKYRIMIVGIDNDIYNLEKDGDKVKGWKYVKSQFKINKNPVHFIVNNKDYILNSTKGEGLKLLARNGSDRVTYKNASRLESPIYISKNGKLYAKTFDNKIFTADVNGKISIEDIGLNSSSKITNYNEKFIYSIYDSLSFGDLSDSIISLDSEVEEIKVISDFVLVKTINSLYVYKNFKLIKGFPVRCYDNYDIDIINGNVRIVILKENKLIYYSLSI